MERHSLEQQIPQCVGSVDQAHYYTGLSLYQHTQNLGAVALNLQFYHAVTTTFCLNERLRERAREKERGREREGEVRVLIHSVSVGGQNRLWEASAKAGC